MTNTDSDSPYSVAQVHLREFIDLPDAIRTLAGLDKLYGELAFLDATLNEQSQLVRLRPDSEKWAAHVQETIGRDFWKTVSDASFDPSVAVRGTDAEPRIVTAHPAGSWIIDLVGKINPIENIKSLLEMVRDWKTDKDRKRLLNSKIGIELIKQEIEAKTKQVDLVVKTVDLLKRVNVPDEDIQNYVVRRIGGITEGVLLAAQGTRSVDVVEFARYITLLQPQDPSIQIAFLMNEHGALPGVWSIGNQLLPRRSNTAKDDSK